MALLNARGVGLGKTMLLGKWRQNASLCLFQAITRGLLAVGKMPYDHLVDEMSSRHVLWLKHTYYEVFKLPNNKYNFLTQ